MPEQDISVEAWFDQKFHFYRVRALNQNILKTPCWNQEIQIPLNAQCNLMFQNLRKILSEKHQRKLSKLEPLIRQALKKLFFQPSEEKVVAFKKRYREIIDEGDVIFKEDKALWQDCILPGLIDIANAVVAAVQFCLSLCIPSLRNYKGAFFEKSNDQTHEEASNRWKQEMMASQDIFHQIADHAVTLK